MHFSNVITAALTVAMVTIPVFAAPLGSSPASQNHAVVKLLQNKAELSKAQANEVAADLQAYGKALHKELQDCIAAPGENTAECFNRQDGMNLPESKSMTADEIDAATLKYSKLVGARLGACTKKHGFYTCLEQIRDADDKKKFNFKRGWGTDFMNGFIQGFTGVFKFVTPLVTAAAPLAAKLA